MPALRALIPRVETDAGAQKPWDPATCSLFLTYEQNVLLCVFLAQVTCTGSPPTADGHWLLNGAPKTLKRVRMPQGQAPGGSDLGILGAPLPTASQEVKAENGLLRAPLGGFQETTVSLLLYFSCL